MVSTGPFQTELSHKSMHLVGRSQKAGQRKTREPERYQTAPRARISSTKKKQTKKKNHKQKPPEDCKKKLGKE